MDIKVEFARLLDQIALGDQDAMSQFANLFRGRTYSIAYSVCHIREDAEDIVQEVFIKLLTLERDKYPSSGHASWFYLLTKNTAIDYLRAKKPTVDIEKIPLADPSSEDEIEYFEGLDAYEYMVKGLSSDEKLVVGLRVLGGMKHREIAAMLEKPQGTIRWIYHKAIHALRLSISSLGVFLVALVFVLSRSKKAMAGEEYIAWRDPVFWAGWVMIIFGILALYFLVTHVRHKSSSTSV